MKVVIISEIEFIELSEHGPIELYCEVCRMNTWHKPAFTQIIKSLRPEILEDEKGNIIAIPDLEDAFIVSCKKCGEHIIARWGRTIVFPP